MGRLAVRLALIAICAGLGTALIAGCSDDSTKPDGGLPPAALPLEAESFEDSSDGGGAPITVPYCSGASGLYAVEGVDSAGDWIELPLVLSERTCFSDSIRGEGIAQDVRRFEVLFLMAGEVAARDTLVTPPGRGFG